MICSSPQSAKRHGVQLHDDSVSTMNRFNLLKARTRANIYQIFVLLFFLLAPQVATAVHYTAPVPCTAEQQNKIMNYSQHTSCQARDTVIDLKAFVANMSDVIHIVPDVALVKRCGGNCIRPSHRCISITKQKKMIPIMMILPSSEDRRSKFPTRSGEVFRFRKLPLLVPKHGTAPRVHHFWHGLGRIDLQVQVSALQMATLFNRIRFRFRKFVPVCSDIDDGLAWSHRCPDRSHRLHPRHRRRILHDVSPSNRFVPAESS